MAVQGGGGYRGISSMLIERMSDIRDTYQIERKKRLSKENGATNTAPKSVGYRYSYKSGQAGYTGNKEKN